MYIQSGFHPHSYCHCPSSGAFTSGCNLDKNVKSGNTITVYAWNSPQVYAQNCGLSWDPYAGEGRSSENFSVDTTGFYKVAAMSDPNISFDLWHDVGGGGRDEPFGGGARFYFDSTNICFHSGWNNYYIGNPNKATSKFWVQFELTSKNDCQETY